MIISSIVPPSPQQWDVVVRGARRSWESYDKSDSTLIDGMFSLGAADRALLTRLAIAGADHGKYLRMLPVLIEARATGTFLRHLYTYRVGVEVLGVSFEATDLTANSTSVMHTAGRRAFTLDDLDARGIEDAVIRQTVDNLNRQRCMWLAVGKGRGAEWRGLVNLLPSAWWYDITLSVNYAVVRAWQLSRANHRLRDDWGVLCDALESLPHAALTTARRGGAE